VKLSLARTRSRLFVAMVRDLTEPEVTPQRLHALLSQALGEETLSQKRARAGSAGGRRSVAVRTASLGTAQPRSKTEAPTEPPSKQTPDASEASTEAKPEANPVPSAESKPQIHLVTSDPDPERSKEIAVVSEGSDRFSREPETAATANFDEAEWLDQPLAHRCALVLENPALGRRMVVHAWPEVDRIWLAWNTARGLSMVPPFGRFPDDKSLKAIVELLSKGYLPSDLDLAARRLPKTEKYRDRQMLWSVFTPTIVDIELGSARAEQAREAARRGPAPVRAATRVVEPDADYIATVEASARALRAKGAAE
jgi:hypothetical protein